MAEDAIAPALVSALRALVTWWSAEEIRGVLIGGAAVALLGRPRLTHDVDALTILDEAKLAEFVDSGVPFGFAPRFNGALDFARSHRVILLRHEPSSTNVDIALGILAFEFAAVEHGSIHSVGDLQVPLPSVDDLIVMKAAAGRGKDEVDIEGLLDMHPEVDLASLRRKLAEFAELLESPEMLQRFDFMVANRPKRH